MEHPENNEEYKGLTVNAGIEQPSIVNPYLKLRKKPKRREFSVGEYVEGILQGNMTVLSQAVTLVESLKPEHQALAQEVIEKCLPHSGNSVRIGISGVPGAGKSTSIDVFGLHVLEKGGKLAVLAIDPSSERTKGETAKMIFELAVEIKNKLGIALEFVNFGGGKAPEGLCGALYAAMLLSPEACRENVRKKFVEFAGADTCFTLKMRNRTSCIRCVEKAAELVEKFGSKRFN